jgi:peptide/nickel transport system substrate-binding protein
MPRLSALVVAIGAALAVSLIACGQAEDASPAQGGAGGGGAATRTATADSTAAAAAAADFARMPKYTNDDAAQSLLEEYDYRKFPYYHPDKEPMYGGTMRMVTNMPGHFNPLTSGASRAISSNGRIFNQLIQLNYQQELMFTRDFICDVCERFEVSDDGLAYTFYIQDDVFFHDKPPVNGRQLTAADVAFAMNIYKDESVQSAVLQNVEVIEAVDDFTVVIRLKEPVAGFIATLSPQAFPIFARECYETEGCLEQNPIGTGPFQLKEWIPNDRLILERNPRYFKVDEAGRQLPYLDGIEEYQFEDFTAQVAAFRTGKIDNLEMGFGGDIDIFRSLVNSVPEAKHQINSEHTCCASRLVPNYANDGPWQNVDVRRALSLAIDQQHLIDTVCGGGCVGGSPIPFDMMGHEFSLSIDQLGPYQQHDPGEAERLLDQAGYPRGSDGVRMTLKIRHSSSASTFNQLEAIAQMWDEIGVKLEFQPTETVAWREMLFAGSWEELMWGGESRYGMDSFQHGYELYHTDAPKNFMHYSDPVMDDLMERERLELDPEAREALTREIFDREQDQVPVIWGPNFWHFVSYQPWVWQAMDHLHGWWRWWGSKHSEVTWVDERSPTRR